ncbi:MAG TPA: hypothetical protein VHN20_18160, partial [Beijerinckiaceae bacterium]|nr:hypothetical protein [Beijerinckiaceae bacterium]
VMPPIAHEPPAAPEGFVECSRDESAQQEDRALAHIAAPRCDSGGYAAWRLAVTAMRAFIAQHRRDCLFIGALPLPAPDASRPSGDGRVYAETEFLAFLRRAGVLEPDDWLTRPQSSAAPSRRVDGLELDGSNEPPPASAASAFVQLAWPWLVTRHSADLPELLEPGDGLLVGMIATAALLRGTFRSVAGTRLTEVLAASPATAWGLGPDSAAAQLAARLCLIAPEPEGWTLVSDVTTSTHPSWQQAGVRRLTASVLRAARTVGEGVLFEPNGPPLWTRLRLGLEDLMTGFWREGGLRGQSTEDAFTVQCDGATMSQNDIDGGRLVAHIGFLPATAVERVTIVLALDPGGAVASGPREVA